MGDRTWRMGDQGSGLELPIERVDRAAARLARCVDGMDWCLGRLETSCARRLDACVRAERRVGCREQRLARDAAFVGRSKFAVDSSRVDGPVRRVPGGVPCQSPIGDAVRYALVAPETGRP